MYKGAAKDEDLSDKDVALMNSIYESAFLADIGTSYVLEKTEECFEESIYWGIYQDDGLEVFIGQHTKCEIQQWLQKYQGDVGS